MNDDAIRGAIGVVVTRWYKAGLLRFNSRDDGSDDLLLRDELFRAVVALAALSSPETTPAGGTTTDCPLEGVHEHPFRGPHRFHEWDPANFAPGTPNPAGVLDEAALREALAEILAAYDATPADVSVDTWVRFHAAMLAGRAALGRSGSGGGRG